MVQNRQTWEVLLLCELVKHETSDFRIFKFKASNCCFIFDDENLNRS